MEINLLKVASFSPAWLEFPKAWVGHLPFAQWVMHQVKPKVFVELGTHTGNSYFSFCQAVQELDLPSKCFSVDTWSGDEHAGFYGDEVFSAVNAHHEKHYSEFSRLLRMTFDEAIEYFADGSINLLHIDGLHIYEAIRHDFEAWLPKLAPGAMVIFHDTNVRERNFGVWKLWAQLQEIYPNNIEFKHSHGLGVLQLNHAPEDKQLGWLQPNFRDRQLIVNYFASLGSRQLERYSLLERDGEIANLNQAVTERDGEIANLNQAVTERDGEIANLNQAVTERDGDIQNLTNTIQEIRSSISWRVSAPVRWVGWWIRHIKNLSRLPLVVLKRGGRVKNTLVKSRHIYKTEGLLGLKRRLLRNYEFETVWQDHGFSATQSYFAPRAETNFDLSNCPIKAIALYLPQFHPIPENNEWWGKGFTEWTNVSKAVPQFLGHYQPHLPGELGFYDLRLVDIQRQQIELAKQYGIHGFCYHHYWFGGKKLLQGPFNRILTNPDLDFPFCLCWANENWTRRWDGRDQDVLVTQNHSPEDDLAFIADIAPALQDRRYIRFNGRPILIVYRVSLLPDAHATAQRWREYCRAEGIGELYLVAARSFGIKDPRAYGFDASLEFPPHEVNPRILNDDVEFLNPDFEGNVYSYNEMVDSYLAIDSNDYPIIKTVCPGWDNEARKPGRGDIFFGSNPDTYARWLRGARDWTLKKCASNSKHPPFVFVNAWNEWAEGAHLEPDRKYGYANLHVTANSLQAITPRSSDIQAEITDSQSSFRRASDGAVILHFFYGDLLDEILPYLENTKNMDLFVSLGLNVSIDDIRRLRKVFPNCYIEAYLNKGRDLLPFINLLKVIKSYGYAYGCKLHTKKSLHRNDGSQLRSEAFKNLIGTTSQVQKFIQFFEEDKELGMAGPSNSFIDLAETKINLLNRYWLDNLLPKLGRPDLIGSYSWRFFAGTMFWFRVDALSWLLSWDLSADDFEYELGQLDGTLAHALERCVCLGVTQSGYRISCELNQSEK
jgi:lipopolysaccharide biosynthesis protein